MTADRRSMLEDFFMKQINLLNENIKLEKKKRLPRIIIANFNAILEKCHKIISGQTIKFNPREREQWRVVFDYHFLYLINVVIRRRNNRTKVIDFDIFIQFQKQPDVFEAIDIGCQKKRIAYSIPELKDKLNVIHDDPCQEDIFSNLAKNYENIFQERELDLYSKFTELYVQIEPANITTSGCEDKPTITAVTQLILPIFLKVYNTLEPINKEINADKINEDKLPSNLEDSIGKLASDFPPLFRTRVKNDRNISIDVEFKVELFSGNEIIARSKQKLKINAGEINIFNWWLKFDDDKFKTLSPLKAHEAKAFLWMDDKKIAESQDVTIGTYNQMAWHSSVLTNDPRRSNVKIPLKKLNLVKYGALWVVNIDLITPRYDSNEFKKAHTLFLMFLNSFRNTFEQTISCDAIVRSFAISLTKLREMRSYVQSINSMNDYENFRIVEQCFGAYELNNLQEVNPPEMTLLKGEGNCINLAILLCTLVELLGENRKIATGILFTVHKNTGHVYAVLAQGENQKYAYDLIQLREYLQLKPVNLEKLLQKIRLDAQVLIDDENNLFYWNNNILERIKDKLFKS